MYTSNTSLVRVCHVRSRVEMSSDNLWQNDKITVVKFCHGPAQPRAPGKNELPLRRLWVFGPSRVNDCKWLIKQTKSDIDPILKLPWTLLRPLHRHIIILTCLDEQLNMCPYRRLNSDLSKIQISPCDLQCITLSVQSLWTNLFFIHGYTTMADSKYV